MRRCFVCAVVACAVLAPVRGECGDGPPVPGTGARDEVVATVNGERIMLSEVVRELLIQRGMEVIEKVIARRALRQDMAKRGIQVTDAEVDAAIEKDTEAILQIYGEDHTLEQVVRRKLDMDFESYREEVVRLRLYMKKLMVGRIRPDETDLLIFFAQNRSQYDVPDQAKVRHLLVAVSPGSPRGVWQAARVKAERFRRQAAGGIDFVKLIRLRSDDKKTRRKGGLLGVIAKNDERITEEMRNAIFALRPGQVGGPVLGREGYHIVQVVEFMAGRRIDFEKVVDRVRTDYVKARLDDEAKLYIRRLIADSKISRRLRIPARSEYRPPAVAPRVPDERAEPGAGDPEPGIEPVPDDEKDEGDGKEEDWPTFRK